MITIKVGGGSAHTHDHDQGLGAGQPAPKRMIKATSVRVGHALAASGLEILAELLGFAAAGEWPDHRAVTHADTLVGQINAANHGLLVTELAGIFRLERLER